MFCCIQDGHEMILLEKLASARIFWDYNDPFPPQPQGPFSIPTICNIYIFLNWKWPPLENFQKNINICASLNLSSEKKLCKRLDFPKNSGETVKPWLTTVSISWYYKPKENRTIFKETHISCSMDDVMLEEEKNTQNSSITL